MDDAERLELCSGNQCAEPCDKLAGSKHRHCKTEYSKRRLEDLHGLDPAPYAIEAQKEKEEDEHNGIHDLIHSLAEIEETEYRYGEVRGIIFRLEIFAVGICFICQILHGDRIYLSTVMLDRFRTYVAEVVAVCMIMIDISDGREVHARNLILHDGEIRKVRQEAVHYGCKGICERIVSRSRIKVHHLLVSRTSLEKQSRSPRASGLDIDHESDIVKDFPVVLPDCGHTHHSDFLGIGEKHLYTLLPVLTRLESLAYCLEDHTDSISVVRSSV